MKMLNDFKTFILRGNVVDLAIAVVIGAAFSGIVDALVKGIIMPIIGIFGGKPSFDQYYVTINGSNILLGTFLTALVNFLLIAAIIFFLVLQPINRLMARRKTEPPADPTTRDCPYCLSSIPVQATRCAFCTSEVAPVAVAAASAARAAE